MVVVVRLCLEHCVQFCTVSRKMKFTGTAAENILTKVKLEEVGLVTSAKKKKKKKG